MSNDAANAADFPSLAMAAIVVVMLDVILGSCPPCGDEGQATLQAIRLIHRAGRTSRVGLVDRPQTLEVELRLIVGG